VEISSLLTPRQPSDILHPCAFTMIHFITFILTLLLSHIARATPACGDVASPEELYDPTYADAQHAQHAPRPPPGGLLYNVTWSNRYDNKDGITKSVACYNLADRYQHFKNFPHFPYIGGASFIHRGSFEYCGTCWNLTDPKTRKTIFVITIDSVTEPGLRFNISKEAFNVLNGGRPGPWLLAEPKEVAPHFCGFKK
jgi:hypothetical protein